MLPHSISSNSPNGMPARIWADNLVLVKATCQRRRVTSCFREIWASFPQGNLPRAEHSTRGWRSVPAAGVSRCREPCLPSRSSLCTSTIDRSVWTLPAYRSEHERGLYRERTDLAALPAWPSAPARQLQSEQYVP